MKENMKKLILILALVSTNVFAAGSPTSPLASGRIYYFKSNTTCRIGSPTVDTSHEMGEGQRTFTASTSVYATWVSAQGFASPPPLSNSTNKYITDDSANNSSTSITYLNETAVQWGSINSASKNVNFYNSNSSFYSSSSINDTGPIILVSFNYSNTNSPSPKVTIGYAAYTYSLSSKTWQRFIINFGSFTNTTAATQFGYIGYNNGTDMIGNTTYPSVCFESGQHFQ